MNIKINKCNFSSTEKCCIKRIEWGTMTQQFAMTTGHIRQIEQGRPL